MTPADASDARARRVLAFEYNETCWAAALDGLAREVLPECERAVELAPEGDVAKYRDSRGLARALAGDPAGAIEDFRAFVEWARPRDPSEQFTAKRRAWIAALEAGRDPFDTATVSDLRAQ